MNVTTLETEQENWRTSQFDEELLELTECPLPSKVSAQSHKRTDSRRIPTAPEFQKTCKEHYFWTETKRDWFEVDESRRSQEPSFDGRWLFVSCSGLDPADETSQETSELEQIFNGLAKQWRDATGTFALNMRRYAHPTYHILIHTLGKEDVKDVVPLILRELQQRPDIWFEALKVFTKANPAKNARTFHEAVTAWVAWGKQERYI